MKLGTINNRLLNLVANLETRLGRNEDAKGRKLNQGQMADLNTRAMFSPIQHKEMTAFLAQAGHFTAAELSMARTWMGSNAATINGKSLAVRVLMLTTFKNMKALALSQAA